MLTVALIRHGKTMANLQRRYLGRTDESLCREGIVELEALLEQDIYLPVEAVYTSPMKRCVETAGMIYPELDIKTVEGLRECDFGLFANKTYEDLKDCKEYRDWIQSAGQGNVPGGESAAAFQKRCCNAFVESIEEMIAENRHKTAMVLHGGSIMAILAQYAKPKQDFYYWQVKNGHGYVIEIQDAAAWRQTGQLIVQSKF